MLFAIFVIIWLLYWYTNNMSDIDMMSFPVIPSLLMKVFLLNQLFNCYSRVFFFTFLHHSLDVVHILLILPEQEDKLKRTFKSHVS